jgi:hypothetical protein
MFSRRSCRGQWRALRYTGHTIRKPGWTSPVFARQPDLLETATPAVRVLHRRARREGSAK